MKNKYLCILLIATCSTFLETSAAARIKDELILNTKNSVYKSRFMTKDATELFESIEKLDLKKIKELIANKVNINAKNASGCTPLMWALVSIQYTFEKKKFIKKKFIKIGDPYNFDEINEIIEILLENGADVNAYNDERNTPLMQLALSKKEVDEIETYQSVINYNNDKLREDFFKNTAKKILSKKANVYAVNKDGETALSIAVRTLNRDLVELIIEAGAYIIIYGNEENKTVLDLIQEMLEKEALNSQYVLTTNTKSIQLKEIENLIKENLEFRPHAIKMFQVVLQKELNNNLTNLPTDITNIISEYASDYDGYYNYLYS